MNRRWLTWILICMMVFSLMAESAFATGSGAVSAADEPEPLPTETVEETPDPTDEPEPTASPEPSVPIEVGDLCSVAGVHAVNTGYNEYFSFSLPEVSGPDTAYLRSVNDEVEGIYNEYVAPTLKSLEEDD